MSNNCNFAQAFPQLESMKKSGIVYLDSAATSLKLKACMDAQYDFDLHRVANVHRGAHRLSGAATQAYEDARSAAADYLNCKPEQIAFTKGTTDSINLIAHHYEQILTSKDAVLLTEMEHHANILPWQRLVEKTNATLLYAKVNSDGELDLNEIRSLLENNPVKVFSLCHASNTLGTQNQIEEISKICKSHSVELVIDGAQAVTTMRPDLSNLDTVFYTFSAHKIFGPFGVGVLYVKDVSKTHIYQQGGGIITDVDFHKSEFVSGPQKFETGTPHISGIISLTPLFNFLKTLNFSEIRASEKTLLKAAEDGLSQIEGYQGVGTSASRINILSFNFKGVHANDLCELLDEQGLALRSGHHCTKPLLKKMGLSGCARASFSIYNSLEDVEKLILAVNKSLEVLR